MPRPRALTWLGLLAWTLLILRATLWPDPPQEPVDETIRHVIATLHDAGAPEQVGYSLAERAANVALFVPLGVLAALALRRRWHTISYAALLAGLVEIGQAAWFPRRDPSVRDVLLNTLGAGLGWLAVEWVWRRSHRLGTTRSQ